MTSKPHSASDFESLVAIAGGNPTHTDSLNFTEHQSASHQNPSAFQPDALATSLYSSNHVGVPTLAPVTNLNGWAAKQDWARHQALIKRLYLYEKKALGEVMRFMESQHGFKATSVLHVIVGSAASLISLSVKMYKTQIKRWGLDKKNKEFEMRAIVRKRKQRADEGKSSVIRVRGQPRDFAEVLRYWDRKGVSIDDLIARQTASPTPEAVELFTPLSSPILTPQVLAIPERIFRCIRDYFQGSFESGKWVRTEPIYERYSIKDEENAAGRYVVELSDQCLIACSLFKRNMFHEAGQTLIAATAKITNILAAEHPRSLTFLFRLIVNVRDQRRDELAVIILRQFSALGKVLLGSEHPLSRICKWANSVNASDFDDVVVRCMKCMADKFESFVGPMHMSTISSRVELVKVARKGNACIQMLQVLLGECEKTLRPDDLRVLWVRTWLADEYFHTSYYVQAWTMSQKNIAYVQSMNDAQPYTYEEDLYMVAKCQYALGEVDSAIATLHEVIESGMSRWGPQDSRAGCWYVTLEDWYLEQGRWSSAAEVRDWREKLLEPI